MDHLASVLLAFPPDVGFDTASNEEYDKTIRAHVSRVNKLLKEKSSSLVAHSSTLIKHLDPAVNSISYLALLQGLIDGNQNNTPDLPDRVLTFLLTFDARQMRYVGGALDRLMTFIEYGNTLPPSIAVEAIATAILRLDPTGSVFTTHHLGLVKLAYTCGHVGLAQKVMGKTIVYYPGMANQTEPKYLCDMNNPPPSYISVATGITEAVQPRDVLEYDVLCGQAYCEREDFAEAFAAFERGLTYPTREGGVSRLMVEAYNRWVLVSLLLHGRSTALPPETGSTAAKAYQVLGRPYAELARLFETGAAEGLRDEAQRLEQFWQDEGTWGLVREVQRAFQRWQVLGLRDVYAKISLAEIRARTECAERGGPLADDAAVEHLLATMIDSGMLDGRIEPASGGSPAHLVFLPAAAEQLSEAQFAAELAAAARRVRALEPVVKDTGERLRRSKDYVRHVMNQQKREKEGNAREAFEAQIEDEDLMTGIAVA